MAVFLVAVVFLPKASNPKTVFSVLRPPPLPTLCPDILMSLLLVTEPVTLIEPVNVSIEPLKVKLVSATAAVDVPSDVNTLLSAAFDIAVNPAPEVPLEPDVPETPLTPEEPDVPLVPDVPLDVPPPPETVTVTALPTFVAATPAPTKLILDGVVVNEVPSSNI